MIRSQVIISGAAALLLALAACGPGTDEAEISVRTSEPADNDTTLIVQSPPDTVTNTIVEQRTDTVLKEGVVVQKQTDTVVRTVPGATIVVTDLEKQQIDRWLAAHTDSLNEYGDPKEMVYTGGTPLYNEATGRRITKYEYIVMKHPDKPWTTMNSPADAQRRR